MLPSNGSEASPDHAAVRIILLISQLTGHVIIVRFVIFLPLCCCNLSNVLICIEPGPQSLATVCASSKAILCIRASSGYFVNGNSTRCRISKTYFSTNMVSNNSHDCQHVSVRVHTLREVRAFSVSESETFESPHCRRTLRSNHQAKASCPRPV